MSVEAYLLAVEGEFDRALESALWADRVAGAGWIDDIFGSCGNGSRKPRTSSGAG